MTVDTLAEIDAELKRSTTPRTTRKQVFLYLSVDQKALIRPIYNLNSVVSMMKHFKWNDNADYKVDAICAREIGEPCELCLAAQEEKKLTASKTFFVPVYVYSVVSVKTGARLTYKDPNTKEQKPVVGFRVLELSAFGKISGVLTYFRSFLRDNPEHDITVCDFTIELSNSGTSNSYVVQPQPAKPMHPQIRAKAPALEAFRKVIIEARPPQIVQNDDMALGGLDDDIPTDVSPVPAQEAEDDIPEF